MQANAKTADRHKKSIWPMFFLTLAMFALFAVVGRTLLSIGNRGLIDEETVRAKERRDILVKVKLDNNSLISNYAWVDREKGVVRIPLSRAVELTTARLAAQGEPKPAAPVDPSVSLESIVKPGGLAVPAPTPPPFAAPQPAATAAPEANQPEAAPLPPVPAQQGGTQP